MHDACQWNISPILGTEKNLDNQASHSHPALYTVLHSPSLPYQTSSTVYSDDSRNYQDNVLQTQS